jgi:hypothetical protein
MTDIELALRLERLERDNLWLKRYGVVVLAVVTGLVAVAATRPVPQKITAHEFDVLDSSGKVGITIRGRIVNVLDADSGLPRLAIGNVSPGVVGAWLFEGHGSRQVELPGNGGPDISIFDTQGRTRERIGLVGGEPRITLNDTQGFRMDLGSTNTMTFATGTSQYTSAASIIMFGNDKKHHVIWQAP